MRKMVWLVVAIGLSACGGVAPSMDRAPRPGECVLPVSGPEDYSAAFDVDDGRSAEVWQPCADFATTPCPAGDACRMGAEIGHCAGPQE